MQYLTPRIIKVILILLTLWVIAGCIFMALFLLTERSLVPKEPMWIADDICLKFKIIGGTKYYHMYSYDCNSAPNWNEVEPTNDGSAYFDRVYTIQCPIINTYQNVVEIKQDKICKFFAPPYPEGDYQKFSVNEEGKFIPI